MIRLLPSSAVLLNTAIPNDTIVKLTPEGVIHYFGRNEGQTGNFEPDTINAPASDILNYMGYYDAKGNSIIDRQIAVTLMVEDITSKK